MAASLAFPNKTLILVTERDYVDVPSKTMENVTQNRRGRRHLGGPPIQSPVFRPMSPRYFSKQI